MATATYTIIKHRRNGKTEATGTLAELTKNFGYTLQAGHDYNNKINLEPTTIKGLVSALNKSVEVLQIGSYNPDYYEIG